MTERAVARAVTLGAAAVCTVVAVACTSSGTSTEPTGTAAVAGSGTVLPSSSPSTPSAASSTPSSPTSTRPTSSASRHSTAPTTAAPTTGGALSVVPTHPARTLSPTPIHSKANFGGGVSARITKVAHGTTSGSGPGVIAGRAQITLTIAITNGSRSTIDINTVQVAVTYGADKTPGDPSDSGDDAPLSGSLRPGRTASGTYSFAVPANQQHNVTVSVWYRSGRPTLLFRGSVH